MSMPLSSPVTLYGAKWHPRPDADRACLVVPGSLAFSIEGARRKIEEDSQFSEVRARGYEIVRVDLFETS